MGKVKKQVSLFFKSVKKKETEKENHLWLIVLSDIMTNLMLFFLMLYVFTIQGAEAQKAFAASLKNEKIVEKEKKAE
ncbi:MAG: flagellar motor protein MotB, partial [Elusimicrobiales bacterium]|nr:flagellar motor protein MotB [Elusimicrobiales bacterium]